jgi:hypothetical protein
MPQVVHHQQQVPHAGLMLVRKDGEAQPQDVPATRFSVLLSTGKAKAKMAVPPVGNK